MKTKHTPGPWSVDPELPHRVIDDEHNTICDTAQGFGWTTAHANARLIAAAPELFDACKKAVAALDSLVPGRGGCGDAYDALFSAIAKAETS